MQLDELKALALKLKESGQLTDLLEEAGALTGLFNCSTQAVLPEGDYGNIYRRQMVVETKGATFEGHQHNFDHVTYLIRGKILMQTWKAGADGERHPGTLREEVFQAPAAILIRKQNFHKFTALTDDVIAECVYALRDHKSGAVTESWDGSMHPYK